MAYADSSPTVSASIAAWKEQAARLGGRDTMLQYRDSRDGSIDLSGAHPSGLAQLLAGRSTRLSSLVRDPDLLADARRRARSIRQKAEQLSYERGITAAHLAIGFATWSEDADGGRREYAAPILLRHVRLVPRGSRVEDFEIALADDITVNPALVEFLERAHGVRIDVDEWVAATGFSHGFDPAPVYERLRAATKSVPGLLVNQRLVVSTFANLATPFTQDTVPAEHPVIRALAGDVAARRALGTPAAEAQAGSGAQTPAAEEPADAGAAEADGNPAAVHEADARSDSPEPAGDTVPTGGAVVTDGTVRAADTAPAEAAAQSGARADTAAEAREDAPADDSSHGGAAAEDSAPAAPADPVRTDSGLPADGVSVASAAEQREADEAKAAAVRPADPTATSESRAERDDAPSAAGAADAGAPESSNAAADLESAGADAEASERTKSAGAAGGSDRPSDAGSHAVGTPRADAETAETADGGPAREDEAEADKADRRVPGASSAEGAEIATPSTDDPNAAASGAEAHSTGAAQSTAPDETASETVIDPADGAVVDTSKEVEFPTVAEAQRTTSTELMHVQRGEADTVGEPAAAGTDTSNVAPDGSGVGSAATDLNAAATAGTPADNSEPAGTEPAETDRAIAGTAAAGHADDAGADNADPDESDPAASDAAAAGEGADEDERASGSALTTARPRRLLPPRTDVGSKRAQREPEPPAAARMTVLNPEPLPLPDRLPQEEFLAIDVDGDQQAVIDAALEGTSLVAHTPPGTGATQTAVALAAALAHTGHSVLYIAQSSDVLDEFSERLAEAGLPDFAVDGRASAGELKQRLISLISAAERAKRPELGDLLADLNAQRETLRDHEHALHRVREPWHTSVYDTMEKLAELTGGDPGPSTGVRFSEQVMGLPAEERAQLRAALVELSDLGAFTLGTEDTVWLGARFDSDEEAERARSIAERTARRVPDLVAAVEPVLREAGLNPPRSAAEWNRSLHVLTAVEKTLTTLKPEAFTVDLEPLIAATGTGEYRREHGIEMGFLDRGRHKRAARELVRTGVQADDLHGALVAARDERAALRTVSGRDGLPRMPEALGAAVKISDDVRTDIDALRPVLSQTPDGGDLDAMLVEEMQGRLAALGEDRESLADLPRRTRLEERLRGAGFGELVDDLRERRVRHALVGAEFDLAYWATVLQQMAAEDSRVGGHDGERLHAAAEAFAEADSRYVAAGAERLRYSHATGWKRAIAEYREQAEAIRAALRSRHLHVDELSSTAPDVLKALAPVWMMSPFQVPEYFVDAPLFDTVILADANRLSVPEVIPAIARAGQVIALGDDHLLGPREFSVAVDRRGQREAEDPSVFVELSRFLPAYRLHTNHRVSPQSLTELANEQFYASTLRSLPTAHTHEGSGLEFAYVPDALGAPDSATGQVESPDAEVRRVVDLVLRHARTRARQSLAVVTLTPWHAQRVAAGIQQAIRDYPYVASFFNDSGREPFVVTDAEQVQGIVRDAVIFSLGYGRTLQGRVVYSFGALSQPGGDRLLATVVTRARRKLTVVSCFEPGDFDRGRLHHGAAVLPDLLAAAASGLPSAGARAESAAPDPLMGDIAERLLRRGVAPVEDYRGIDLALPVGGTEDQGMAVAVEGDGRAYSGLPSIRERERLRRSALQRRGWTYLRLWSTDAFVDPQGEADRIFEAWSETVERRSPEAVLSAARAAAVVVGRQGARPKMTPGLSLRAYDESDLFAMLDWIRSDGVFRDGPELAEQLSQTLALKRRGPEASAVAEVVERYRSRSHARRADPAADGPAGEVAQARETDSERASARPVISHEDVMPSYDTGMLRDDEIIDAGLRPAETDEDAERGDRNRPGRD
ncbi:DUF4011 domain-containing protein [Brevibacterium sp. BRM-1]|uniref:DUF4011 domain-containing protein n=1 Tax=Brevibacterium sp. BRM-1 TaxID=2999062 RepID=UPI00227EB65F|nr:DUF4011 domain-containing protein [Brevibacterium sp. BRM-1]WAL40063.1 DUF4011 domain-containing protein [Brevibacterium sp. BRM-1]